MGNNNIQVGLCGWGDHDSLYTHGVRDRDKLTVYASHFPVVEIDSSFYAILSQQQYANWVKATPDRFRFVIKPHQAITGHQRGPAPEDQPAIFRQFEESIQPVVAAGKLAALLLQFPPWFDCVKEHVQYVQQCVQAFASYPLAVEFRHRSWFDERWREKTLDFLRGLGVAHVVCDEPQAGDGCVPIVVDVTLPQLSLVRFHGRNVSGWSGPRRGQNWREVRYLYDYSAAELAEWLPRMQQLAQKADSVYVLFNNNSGGHAAGNAKQFMHLLGIEPDGLHPQQMELF